MKKKHNIGGQAVIEGVMIKSEDNYAVSVRKKNKIITKKEKIRKRTSKLTKKPFIRGIVNLIDMLFIGVKTLIWSAEQQEDENSDEKISKKEIFFVITISFAFAIIFFVALPYFLTILLGYHEETKPILFNLIDGIIRISLFLIYIFAISFMKDVKTLFQNHGAEHKAVNCYEAGKELTMKNVRKFTTIHRRCGTSFVMIVLVISILIFSVLPAIVQYLVPSFLDLNIVIRKVVLFILRLSMIPIIAGVSYEILKLSDKKPNNFILKILSEPGRWLQKVTTREPTTKQLEVAITAVKEILKLEKKHKG